MDAEIRFFMTPKDEADFIQFAKKHVDDIDNSALPHRFILGDCELLFTPTILEKTRDESTMYSGVLEIRIKADDSACKNQIKANTAYKKLRNWIKKKYWSRLAFINKTKKDKLMPSRIHWLAPDAKKWKEDNAEKHILKLSKTSWMVFDIGF